MDFIKGKYKSSIFSSPTTGYYVGLFRVKECSNDLDDLINKTITFTGYFHELSSEETYILYGKYVMHDRYGYQFQVSSYEKVEPVGTDAVVEFLTSSFVAGCGEKTAQKIVDTLGDDAIKLIKEDKSNLDKCGITEKQKNSIYKSIMSYYDSDETIIYLKSLGFSVKEITKMLALYGKNAKTLVENNLYALVDYVDFKKLDKIFFNIYESTNDMRIKACIVESMKRLTFDSGDTYSYKDEIYNYLINEFDIDLYDKFDEYIDILKSDDIIHTNRDKYYLSEYYKDECEIADALYAISLHNTSCLKGFDNYIESIEKEYQIKYNSDQLNAIKTALDNSLTVITGGPGTGKTTIINGLLRMYQQVNGIADAGMNHHVALLAPTGRASKRMSETTNFGASTIHRYLKWNRESNEFAVNEYNRTEHKLIIVDEVSMIDTNIMASLLNGINPYCKLVLVGDEAQLPSVGPGNILKDLIASGVANHVRLESIYRQSEDSFIPELANEIKNMDITSDIESKRDDYNFLSCDRNNVKTMVKEIVKRSIDRGLSEHDMQILAPMYKGENGIDNLNILLQELFNPHSDRKNEVSIGPIIYRENDKVLNLVNNIDDNIFNGDIGYIKEINIKKPSEFMLIDFYGNQVYLKREDMSQIRHAYAMTIHKSQGSEFNHVIMPVTKEYYKMLYNKLIYTGISRAKKSLVLIGSPEAFNYAVMNNYSVERKTTLTNKLMNKFKK